MQGIKLGTIIVIISESQDTKMKMKKVAPKQAVSLAMTKSMCRI